MTLDELRYAMDRYRGQVNREADEMKDSYLALDRLQRFYRDLDASQQELANQIFAEWALSIDGAKRFDALALIREFRVKSTAPALRRLLTRLERSRDAGSPFEHEKVEELLSELGQPRDEP